jgi:hypothetical protein
MTLFGSNQGDGCRPKSSRDELMTLFGSNQGDGIDLFTGHDARSASSSRSCLPFRAAPIRDVGHEGSALWRNGEASRGRENSRKREVAITLQDRDDLA